MSTKPGEKDLSGFVFDIQGMSVHDGPGCRTLIFLNGCTLNCFWCSNPEGISRNPQFLYFENKCIACFNCMEACPEKRITVRDGKPVFNRKFCLNCNDTQCLSVCYTDALKYSGSKMTVKQLMQIVQRDRQFWGSNGGVTLTGGEPLLQIDFAEELLRCCHEAYIHTAIETCGNVPARNFERVLPWLDWIFFDLKHFGPAEHKEATGVDNRLILENARRVSAQFGERLVFRLPLIPGFNDTRSNLDALIGFLKECGRNEINILPLHHLGREKYNLLGREYKGMNYPVPDADAVNGVKDYLETNGLQCYTGGDTPF